MKLKIPNESIKICEYGCGREGKFYFKTPGKWCCSPSHTQCPAKRKEASEANKGQIPWNKGKTEVYSEESLKNITKGNKGKRKLTIEQIQYKYKTFSSEEEIRYNPDKPGEKEIQVHCKNSNCPNSKEKGGWFTSKKQNLKNRIYALDKDDGNDGCFLYCSQYCKDTCPCYNSRIDPFQLAEFERYNRKVQKCTDLTLKYNSNKILNIELRGNKHGYDLDHKFSIIDGFNNDIDPKIIGYWGNLEVIKASDNRTKAGKSSISLEEIQKIGELSDN